MADAAETASRRAATLPSAEEVASWEGFRLDEIAGSSIARVQGAYVDAVGGEPVWLVVRVGRFGRITVLPLRDCAGGAGHVWCAHDREAIRGAPGIDAGRPLTREQELAVCAHFGIGEKQSRGAEIAGRKQGEVTATPMGQKQSS